MADKQKNLGDKILSVTATGTLAGGVLGGILAPLPPESACNEIKDQRHMTTARFRGENRKAENSDPKRMAYETCAKADNRISDPIDGKVTNFIGGGLLGGIASSIAFMGVASVASGVSLVQRKRRGLANGAKQADGAKPEELLRSVVAPNDSKHELLHPASKLGEISPGELLRGSAVMHTHRVNPPRTYVSVEEGKEIVTAGRNT